MGDGKALQMGTSHELGQNFARAFGIEFLDDDRRAADRVDHVVGLVDAHGRRADHGPRRRRRPARAAPARARPGRRARGARRGRRGRALPRAHRRAASPPAIRAQLDDRTDVSIGRRATDWELKGVPVRLEVGPRDLADGEATLARAHHRARTARRAVPLDGVADTVRAELDAEQAALLDEATDAARARTADVTTLDDAARRRRRRLGAHPVGHRSASRAKPSSRTSGVTVRCLVRADGSLPDADDEPELVAVVGRARTEATA